MQGCVEASIGDLLVDESTNSFYSYFWRVHRQVYLAPIGMKGKLLVTMPEADFRSAQKAGRYVVCPPQPCQPKVVVNLGSIRAVEHGDKVYRRHKEVLEDKDRLVAYAGRFNDLYEELHAKDSSLSTSTFYKTLRRYFEGAGVPAALKARWKHAGQATELTAYRELSFKEARATVRAKSEALQKLPATPKKAVDYTVSRRPRERAQPLRPSQYRVNDAATLRVFDEYFKQKRVAGTTLVTLHETMLNEVFSSAQPFGPPLPWPSRTVPSLRVFAHWYRKLYPHTERRANERGKKHVQLNERSKLAEVSSVTAIVGAIGQLDATVWNVVLVGEGEGAPIIGTPVVFRIRCAGSGQLLGIAVGLDSACWDGAALAIANCLEDKKAFCARYGVDLPSGVWDVVGLPATIEADQGETYNKKPTRFMRTSGCAITNLPGASGDLKGGVESDWHTLQVKLNAITPGAIIEKYEGITHEVWAMRGRMTLPKFTAVLLIHEIKKMLTPRSHLQVDPEMTAALYDTSPNSVWRWGEHRRGTGLVRPRNVQTVLLSLLPIRPASVTDRGLCVEGLFYAGDDERLLQAQEAARLRGRKSVRVAYDPNLVNAVYVLFGGSDDMPIEYVKYTLNERFKTQMNFRNRSWREYLATRRQGDEARLAQLEEISETVRALDAQAAQIIAEEDARVLAERADRPASRAQLLEGRPAARLNERNHSMPHLALTAMPPLAEAQTPAPATAQVVHLTKFDSEARRQNRFRQAHQQSTLSNASGGQSD
jgi:hypothetical protein